MTEGGVYLGWKSYDEKLKLQLGEFVLFEAMSNHGKTTTMLNVMINLITSEKNKDNNPMVFYYPYESSATKIYLKLINVIAKDNVVDFNSNPDEQKDSPLGDYSIKNQVKFDKAKETLQTYIEQGNIVIPEGRWSLEDIESCIEAYSNDQKFDGRTKIFMFDYIQIIKTSNASDSKMNWLEKEKIAEDLARIAEDHKCIVITGSQLTDKGDIAQSKSIYNAVTLSFRIFNYSHAKIKQHSDPKLAERFIHKYEGMMTLGIDGMKSRHCELPENEIKFSLKGGHTVNEYREGEFASVLPNAKHQKALENGDALRQQSIQTHMPKKNNEQNASVTPEDQRELDSVLKKPTK